jgi:hypothetical protein
MGAFLMNIAAKTVFCTLQGAVFMSVLAVEVLFILIPDIPHPTRAGWEDEDASFPKVLLYEPFCDHSLLDIIFEIIMKLMTNTIISTIIFMGLLISEKLLTKGAATE